MYRWGQKDRYTYMAGHSMFLPAIPPRQCWPNHTKFAGPFLPVTLSRVFLLNITGKPMIPKMKLDFAPKQGVSETIVRQLIHGLDKRKKIDEAAATRVICGLVAMKGVKTFSVLRNDMTDEEKKAFDAISSSHYTVLLHRQSGLANYAIRDTFYPACVVQDTLQRSLRFSVSGESVEFQNSDAISTPEQVRLINGHHAVSVKMTDVANAFEYVLRGEALPVRFQSLTLGDGQIVPSDEAIALAQNYRDNLDFWLAKSGHVSVFVNHHNDPNEFWFSTSALAVSTLQGTLRQTMAHWFKDHQIPLIHFPMVASTFDGGVAHEFLGDPYQQKLTEMANSA